MLSRPLHKFWPLGEQPELRVAEEQWLLYAGQEVTLLEHAPDWMLVHFWELNGRLHAATRAGPLATAARVEHFIASQRVDYAGFAHCAISAGLTPVFAWCDEEDATPSSPLLVLVALRCMSSGLYVPYAKVEKVSRRFNIPVVSRLATWSPPPGISFAEAMSDLRELALRVGARATRRFVTDPEHVLVSFAEH